MASWLSPLLGLGASARSPLVRAAVPCVAAAVALQAAAAAPSILAQSERFYDVSGAATFLAVGALSLYLPALRARAAGVWNWRQVAATGLVAVWAVRLGSYLFRRVLADGHDSRFDRIRRRPLAFAGCFLAQAAWVSLMLAPVVVLNAAPAAALAAAGALSLTDVLGLGLWAGGFALEAAADAQRSRWARDRRSKLHDDDFMTSGLFSKSRFPHYFGEMTLWTGLATFAAGAVARRPVQLGLGLAGGLAGIATTTAICFASPAFSIFLLTKVSGIPLSEGKYDKRYGDRKDYQEWKKNVPRLVPKIW